MNPQNPNNLTDLQIKQGYSTIPGAFDPLTGKLKTPTAPSTPQTNIITPDALQPQPKITLPTTPTPAPTKPAPDYDAMFGLTDFEKQAQQTQEQGLSEIIKSMTALEGEATDLQAERQRQGLQDKYRENQATKARILALDAEMQQDDIQLAQKLRAEERRDTLLPFAQMGQAKLAGDAAIYRALKTAEKNTLISQQLAQQGDIVLAEQFAKDAVDAKYAPYKRNIENFKTIMEAIKPTLTAAENKLLKVQEMKVTRAENEIKKAEEEEKSIEALKFKIIENGGDPNTITSTNYNEALNQAKGSLMKKDIQVKELNGALYAVTTTPDGKVSVKFVAGGGGGTQLNKNLPYSGIVETIIGSGKFTKDQASAIRNAINTGENPFVVVRNQAKGLMTGANQTKVENYETAQKALQDIQDQLKEFYAKGGKTDIFRGNYEKAINRLGEVSDPALVDLATQIQTSLQVYRNAVSGTAYSVQEGRDIASIFPGINKSEGLNEAILNGRMKAFESTIDGAYEGVLGQKTYQEMKKATIPSGTPKGTMSDRDYVEKVLVSNNIKYDEFINTTPQGQIPVIDNSTGQIGYIPYTEFNSSKYTKI